MYSLLFLTLLSSLTTADLSIFKSSEALAYDRGEYGRVPTGELYSTSGTYNRFLRSAWDSQACEKPDNYYYVVAPHGMLLGHAGPMLVDNDGHQVWFSKGYSTTYNLDIQTYRGESYLTWWNGNNRLRDHGQGYYYMMDKNYNLYKTLHAVGEDMDGDLHEFTITRDNTAIVTIYHTIPYDLSQFNVTGSDEGENSTSTYINESMFQELDIETNELLFEWRAIDHIPLTDNYHGPRQKGATFETAWDWFHINSVDKDPAGNYLISSRYTHALYYLDGQTGEVLWQLGGIWNNFTDLSDGRATSIARQHHARWEDDYSSITVFDNGEDLPKETWRSRGLKIAVDAEAMTAEVLAEAYHPHNYTSVSQGSAQQLENGNFLVGWGNTAGFTEFSADGSEVLCDWQFSALYAGPEGKWSPGSAESYRVSVRQWHGYPLYPPEVSFRKKDGNFYVSWNGATELRYWLLEGSKGLTGDENGGWELISHFKRAGFESNTTVGDSAYKTFRLTALDANQNPLGSWAVYSSGVVTSITPPNSPSSTTSSSATVWHTRLLFALSGAILTISFLKICQHRHQFRNYVTTRARSFQSWIASSGILLLPSLATFGTIGGEYEKNKHWGLGMSEENGEDLERTGLVNGRGSWDDTDSSSEESNGDR